MTFLLADWYPPLMELDFPNWWWYSRSTYVVPMLYQDMEMPETPFGAIFISDSTTSYGSYSELFRMKKLL
jgi:hypothetical protein